MEQMRAAQRYILAARLATQAWRAENLAARGKTAAAFAVLSKIYRTAGDEMPSSKLPVELNITLSQISISEHNGPLALLAAETVLSQLIAGDDRYGVATRVYLVAFCQALVSYCLAWRDRGQFVPPANDVISGMELDAVDARILRRFPLPEDGRFI